MKFEMESLIKTGGVRRTGNTFRTVLACVLKASYHDGYTVAHISNSAGARDYAFRMARSLFAGFDVDPIRLTLVLPNKSRVVFFTATDVQDRLRGVKHELIHDAA